MGMGNLAKMAQQMQAEMARAEADLAKLTVEGSAGGGAVTVVATGKQEIVSITISPDVVDPDDVEMLQDLVLAAVTEALNQSRDASAKRMERVTGGFKIPGF